MEDEKIVALYFARAETAIAETEAKYGSYCYAIAFGILACREDAEESVNDTYAAAWRSIPPHRPALLSAYLGKLTRRIAIDRWRRRTAARRGGGELPLMLDELAECLPAEETVEQTLDRRRLGEVIADFIRTLPRTEQQVFLCRYWYADSVDTVCRRFGFGESRVKSMLARTREKLRKRLQEEGFD